MPNFNMPSAMNEPAKPKAEEVVELSPADIEEVEDLTAQLAEDEGEEAEEIGMEEMIEVREPGELQEADVIKSFEIKGFKGLDVHATLEKKNVRKEGANPEDRAKEGIRNQDNIVTDAETGLIGVMDGLGGEGQGDLASLAVEKALPHELANALEKVRSMSGRDVQNMLVDRMLNKIGDPSKRVEVTNDVETALQADPRIGKKGLALLAALHEINNQVKETKGKTTFTGGFIHETPDGSHWAVIANVGDGAAFLQKKDGTMEPLTQEDSLFNALSNAGKLDPELLQKMKANPDQKMPLPISIEVVRAVGGSEKDFEALQQKGVKELPMSYKKLKGTMVAALGSESAAPSLVFRKLEPGESVIFGTDGLVDKFEDPTTEETNLTEMAKFASQDIDKLREEAKRRTTYKKDDDIAIISVRVPAKADGQTNRQAA